MRRAPRHAAVTTHGEWVKYARGADSIRAYVAYPERKTKAPAVIVIHEIFGLTDWEPTVADRLAKEGFVAIVPDLLSSKHGRSPKSEDEGRKLIGELEPDRITADLDATYAYVNGLPAVLKDRVGTIGFCWGGGQSFRYATNNPNLRAVVVCYGPPPDSADDPPDQGAGARRLRRGRRAHRRHPPDDRGPDAVGRQDLHPGGLPRHRARLPQARPPGIRRSAGRARLDQDPGVLPGAARQVSSAARAALLALLLGAVRAAPLLGQAGTAAPADSSHPPHDPTSYDITLVTSDTGTHVLAEVQTAWRLRTVEPVELELDSVFRVVRVLVDGKPNTRIARTMYARQGGEVVVPHEKAPGDTLTTRVRYHGIPRGGLRVGLDRAGRRALAAETADDRARLWLPVPEGGEARVRVNWNVQAGEGQRVIANGRFAGIDTLAYGHTTWHYRMDVPVPLDALAVAVGRYAVTTLRAGGLCRLRAGHALDRARGFGRGGRRLSPGR